MHYPTPVSKACGNLEQHHLDNDELIVWSGAQVPGFFRVKDSFPLLFGAVWLVISVMLTFYGRHVAEWFNTEPELRLLGIPFILIGAVILTGPLRRYRRESGTLYVITNKRAIIAMNHGRTVARSFWPDQVQQVRLFDHHDGTASIILAARVVSRDDDCNLRHEEVGFLRIDHHKEAFRLLEELASSQ